MKVKIENQSENPLPEYATAQSSGMDLRANLSQIATLKPFERTIIPTGLYLELPEGYEGQIRPRSGLAKRDGITVLNAPGTIDADYRGELKVLLINMSHESVEIAHGQRIAQLIIAPVQKVSWEEGEVLANSDRGTGGYGHSGSY